MVALKLPEREFKGLLKFVRERIKHVYKINLLGTGLTKSALVQTSKNTITPHTSKLKSISKYQFFKHFMLHFEAGETIHYVVPFAIAELGHKCLEPLQQPH